MALLWALAGFAAPAAAGPVPAEGAPRSNGVFYLGAGMAHRGFSGDFKGDSALGGPTEVILIPKVKPALAAVLTAGVRRESTDRLDMGIELSLSYSEHDVTWLGDEGEASYTTFGLAGNLILNRAEGSGKPFIVTGFAVPTLVVENGSAAIGVGVSDATFWGYELFAGGGVRFQPWARWELTVAATYRWTTFSMAKGAAKEGAEIEDPLKSATIVPAASISFRF